MNKLDTLILVSDIPAHRRLLRSVLEERYHLLETVNIQQALLLLSQNSACIGTVIADISSTDTIDAAFAQIPDQVPLILICQKDTPQVLNQGFGYGAADVIPLDYDPDAMLHRIDTITHLHNHRMYLKRMVDEQSQKLRNSNDAMVGALSSIIEYRSLESGQHILRIRYFTKVLLEEVRRCCPEYRLTDAIISVITSASALHDIGKIAIPDAILLKPGILTPDEREIMQTHALTGCHILESMQAIGNEEYLRYAHNICHYHHERWDGTGYPEGLSGDAIPICAQVVGLADVYDALTSHRVYKESFSFDTSATMILNGECGQFSPKLLECFKHVLKQFQTLALNHADGISVHSEPFDVTLPEPAADENTDSLNRLHGNFLTLLHYLNCFVLELFVDMGHFHLLYNPYPELAPVSFAPSFADMAQLVLDQLVVPEDRPRMEQLIVHGIKDFLNAGLRRQSFRFRFRDRNGYSELYDLTLLRSNVNDTSNRTMSILCRKLESQDFLPASDNQDSIGYTFCCRNDRKFTLTKISPDARNLTGFTPEQIHFLSDGGLLSLIHPQDRETICATVQDQLQNGNRIQLDFRILHQDGLLHWVCCNGKLVLGQDGQEYLLCFLTDVSHIYEAYDSLQQKMSRYEVILAQTENVLFDWDVISDTISFSDTWEKVFGTPPMTGSVRSTLLSETFLHPDDVPLLLDALTSLESGSDYEMAEVRVATSWGRYLWCRVRASARRSHSGTLKKVYGIIINIDAEKRAEQDLQDQAQRDVLTKLLNKQTARRLAEEYLAQYPQGVHCALLIIDLDNFKQVNDRFGHLFGDAILTQTSRIIQKMFRNQDIIARIGGDEFLVLMRGIADRALLEDRCLQLIDGIRQLSEKQPQHLGMSCSIGIALSPDHGISYYDLFQHADQALYRAKDMGKNRHVIYEPKDMAFTGSSTRTTAVNNHIDSDDEPGLANNSLVQYAFSQLYASTDVAASVNEILSIVGKKMNVSRVYVFENSDDNRFCSNTYEWCNEGIAPEIHNLQNISYETDIPGYEEYFNEQGIFYCPDINELPQKLYDILAPQGIKSLLHCAIRENGVFRGYIGFDECVTTRMWTNEQIEMLSYFSGMLSVFLLKKREQEKALQSANELRSILDNQNAWIYIIDPDTFQFRYLNKKTRDHAAQLVPGVACHKVLMDNDAPCPNCPALNIRNTKNNASIMYNKVFQVNAVADATLIEWEGKEACLLTCRQIPSNISVTNILTGEKM